MRTLDLDRVRDVWSAEDVFPDPDFPLNVLFANPQPPIPLHVHHEFLELTLVYGGHAVHRVENEVYPIRAGDVFVIQGEKKHGFEQLADLYLVNVVVDERRFLRPFSELRRNPYFQVLFHLEPHFRQKHRFESRLVLTPEELSYAMSLIETLHGELTQRVLGFQAIATGIFLQIVGFCCRCYKKTQPPLTQNLIRIGTILNRIQSRYHEPIQMQDLVKLSGMSERNLQKTFREATGFSPIQYLLRTRIAAACYLLSTSTDSITDIAFRVGFNDSNYFARQFHKLVGITPRKYRKSHQKSPILLPFAHGFSESHVPPLP